MVLSNSLKPRVLPLLQIFFFDPTLPLLSNFITDVIQINLVGCDAPKGSEEGFESELPS
jgi:hypothetical protein